METQREAREAAEALRKLMHNPDDWKMHVWDNLGWHYTIQSGPIDLSATHRRDGTIQYSCLLSEERESDSSGAGVWSFHDFQNEDPNEAVRLQVEYAREVIDRLTETLELAEAVVAGPVKEQP